MGPQLVFIGSGNIGQAQSIYCLPTCLNLVENLQVMSKDLVVKGNLKKLLILWNRSTSRATPLSERIGHSNVAETVKGAVARSEIIFFCFADERGVFKTFNTALQVEVKGKLFVKCSTVRPENMDRIKIKYSMLVQTSLRCPVCS